MPFNQCPKCQKSKAIVTNEETLGIFKKDIDEKGGRGREAMMVPHEKIKFYYRCKYCDHKWTSTKIKRFYLFGKNKVVLSVRHGCVILCQLYALTGADAPMSTPGRRYNPKHHGCVRDFRRTGGRGG